MDIGYSDNNASDVMSGAGDSILLLKRNGALDSPANDELNRRSAAKEESGNDRESVASDESRDVSKIRQKSIDKSNKVAFLSGLLNQVEPDATVFESGTGRKQYECRKCGQPLKGHICSFKSEVWNADVQKSHSLQRCHRRRHSRSPLSNERMSSHAVMMNSGGDRMWDTDDESSWDEDRNTSEIWSKKSIYKISSVGRRDPLERNSRIKCRRLSLWMDYDDDRNGTDSLLFEENGRSQLSLSGKRVYLCRKCGLPRKGHVCQHESVQNHKGPLTESLAAAHILTEEIRLFLQEHSSADRGNVSHSQDYNSEKMLLQSWAANVYNKFSQLKEHARKNARQIDKRKNLTKSINKERDALLALRSKIRQIENESRNLEERIAELRQEHSAYVGASNFLNAIDTLR
jgi:hypothetical protein